MGLKPINLDLLRGVQWRSLSGVGASIGDPVEGAGIDISLKSSWWKWHGTDFHSDDHGFNQNTCHFQVVFTHSLTHSLHFHHDDAREVYNWYFLKHRSPSTKAVEANPSPKPIGPSLHRSAEVTGSPVKEDRPTGPLKEAPDTLVCVSK